MKKLALLYLVIFSSITFGQTLDDYDFELNLKINIENTGSCYSHTTFIKSDSVKVSYYFVHRGVNKAELKRINDDVIKITGNYTTLVGMLRIEPILVIMVEPVYNKKQDCNKKIYTYFVSLGAVGFDITKDTFVLDLQTLNLSNEKYIRLLDDLTQPKIEYSPFIFPEMLQALKFDLPDWYRIE